MVGAFCEGDRLQFEFGNFVGSVGLLLPALGVFFSQRLVSWKEASRNPAASLVRPNAAKIAKPELREKKMPTYDYVCKACGEEIEIFHPMTADPKKKCPACGKLKLKRQIGAGGGLIFKGSGFYITDYRSKEYKDRAEADKKSSEKSSESTSKKSGDSSSGDSSSSKSSSSDSSSSGSKSEKKSASTSEA